VVSALAVVTTWEGSLAALDLADGHRAWKVALGGDSLGPAAAAAPAAPGAAPAVVASFDTGHAAGVAAYDGATGARRWLSPVPADGVSAPAVAGGSVVVVAADAAAHALSLDTGAERWRRPVEGAGSPEVAPLALTDGAIVVAHRQGGLAALDGSDGRVRWTAGSDGAAVRGGPAGPGPNGWFALPLDDGRVLLGGPDREPDARQPGGLAMGVATGPGGVLVVSSGQGDVNGVEAVTGW
jgi:outer membrane protein assembly factor BamB